MIKAVVGANWGDEGKGKITDMLAKEADIIVRFQGGANAGHTIVNNYGKFALHTLPSGVFYSHTTSVIGNGVALNIPVLIKELNEIVSKGVPAPKIKISENGEKITNPGFKGLYRLYSKDTGKARGDVITLAEETIPVQDSYEIFDPNAVWKKTRIRNYEVRNLHVPIFEQGKCVYESPDIETTKKYCQEQMETLWDETLRFENPQTYYVDLSQKLWDMKNRLLQEHAAE